MNRKYTAEELEKLHTVLYEILGEVIRICDESNISYFVIGGTAIGALYDKAMLPWDDDIDIGMTREDYNRFIEVAPKELKSTYFLSWIGSDTHYPFYFLKVRKNNTLFIESLFKDVPMHHGIYIDILPLDRVPDNKILEKIQHLAAEFMFCCLLGKEKWLWRHCGKCEIENPSSRGFLPCLLNRIVDTLFSKKRIYKMLLFIQTMFNSWNTKYFNNIMTETDHISIEELKSLRLVPFGPLMIKAPANLEGFLRYNYPKLHRFTKEEQEKIDNHCPEILSFNTKNEQL